MQQLRLFFAMALRMAIAKNKRNCCILLELFHHYDTLLVMPHTTGSGVAPTSEVRTTETFEC